MSPTATEPDARDHDIDIGIDHEHEHPEAHEEPPRIWEGSTGLAVTAFGILLPALFITISSVACFERVMRLAFKHPVETFVEAAFVLLIPIANYVAWNALCRGDARHPFRVGIMNGTAIATAFIAAALAAASVAFGYPGGFLLIALVAALSGCVSLYIGWRLRDSAGTRQGRANRLLFSALGVVLSVLGFVAGEAKGTVTRIAENAALSDVPGDRDRALDMLRSLNVEQDLRMQCADARTAGLPGIFWRISPERERELYFAVTGKPYGNNLTDSVYSMSDEYLSKHVVGAPLPGLNLRRSQIAGYINPKTLTSSVNWTFVFKNSGFEQQEARAEIAVPPGAMISDLTYWKDGNAHKAVVRPNDAPQLQGAANGGSVQWYDVGKVDPALVTDLGRGRALLKITEVPPQSEVKVQITFTERLKPLELTQASMALPHFVDANFSLNGDYNMRLHSPLALSAPTELKSLHAQAAADGGMVLIGSLNQSDLNGGNFNIGVTRNPDVGPFYAKDPSSARRYIKETVNRVATTAPEHLVVVVDNSQSMKAHVGELIKALEEMPSNVKASLLMPTDGQQMEPVELKRGIELLRKAKFEGGRDNLQAVIKAAESAGESRHSTVLWVHGPQPSFNEEMYIMAPYIERPSFYELALDDRWTDTNEFFKNHREIGPFVPVSRAGTVMADLQSFVSKWQVGGSEFIVNLEAVAGIPVLSEEITGPAAAELSQINARDDVFKLLREGQTWVAANRASAAHIVTPVTGAAVLHRETAIAIDNSAQQLAWQQGATNGTIGPAEYQQHQQDSMNAPHFQGATNGVIMPQGTDATVIAGINTAGTVRVNNLANLEALLNIIANGMELLGLAYGVPMVIRGIFFATAGGKPSRTWCIAMGMTAIAGGLAVPGMMNWMVASARDANLFS